MIENNYPLPNIKEYSDFIMITEEKSNASKLLSVDCEMCTTSIGKLELTRITIVNEEHTVIYDKYVKPLNPIVDYLTRYSGITPELLLNVTTNLSDVQNDLLSSEFIDKNTIICGHSLENDLLALKLIHTKLIDTALLYPANRSGIKFPLRFLTQNLLGYKIQKHIILQKMLLLL